MAAITLLTAVKPRPSFTGDAVACSGGTMRLDASATFDAVAGAHAALVDFTIETSSSSSGPWRPLGSHRLHREKTSDRISVSGCDAYVRAAGRFDGNGGVSLSLSGETL